MNTFSFKSTTTAITKSSIYRYLLVLFFLFISFPLVFFRTPETSLDPSWKIARAIPESIDFDAHKIEIILFSTERKFICKTRPTLRPDVTAHFKNRFNLDNCGFEVIINKKTLAKGNYHVGIYIHKQNSKGKMMVIDQTITKL